MLASQRRRLNKYQAQITFMNDNVSDFPANSPGARTKNTLSQAVQTILTLAAAQSSNARMMHIGIKADNLDKLTRLMLKMSRAAQAMEDEIEGVDDLFRMTRNRSEQSILAAARIFYRDSDSYNENFLEYDLPATFRADLMSLVTAIEAGGDAADSAFAEKGGATGALPDAYHTAAKASRKLEGIVKIKYDDDPQKLAQWKIASHLEAPPDYEDKKPAAKTDQNPQPA